MIGPEWSGLNVKPKTNFTVQSGGHSLIELMICCVLVLVVMLGIGTAITYTVKNDNDAKICADMMEDLILALDIAGNRLAMATNVTVATDEFGQTTNITAWFPGVMFDTNLYSDVRLYELHWVTNELRQTISNHALGAVSNALIVPRPSESISSFECCTNYPGSLVFAIGMQHVRVTDGKTETNNAVLSNVWVKLLNIP